MPTELIGRDAERSAWRSLACPSILLLVGESGIGKTAVWEWVVDDARAQREVVLVTRACAAEARLPWVGLSDLLRAVPAEVFERLPLPQRRALRRVMLEVDDGDIDDERAVATAFHACIALLAESAPVLLAVDDLPWLDSASFRALAFAARRWQAADRVRLVATARGGDVPLVVGDLPRDRIEVRHVGPMSVGGLFELLATRLDVRLTRPVLLRVHETSGGNPLYALELARALARLEITPRPGVPLAVPGDLETLVRGRIENLSETVREVVAGTAASWRLMIDDFDPDAVAAAAADQLVVIDGDVVRAAHPLLSASAYNELTPRRRRALHERLASSSADSVERARHLALASSEPQEEIAVVLDAGTVAALAAGVPDVAVEMAELALAHTRDATIRPLRLDRLADAMIRAGDSAGAVASQREAIAMTAAGPERTRRRIRLAELAVEVTGWAAAEAELDAAVAEAEPDPVVTAEVLLTLAAITDDIAKADACSRRAVALLEALADPEPEVLSGALSQAAGAKFRLGRGLDHALFARAIAIERLHPARRLADRADASYAALLKYADDLDGARERLELLLAEARAIGDLTSIAYVLGHLVYVDLWQGRFVDAERIAREQLVLSEQGGLASQGAQARLNVAHVLAHLGQLDASEAILLAVRDDPDTGVWDRHRTNGALGFVALSRRDPVAAVVHLDRWWEMLQEMHFGEPGYSRWHLDRIVALIATGRVEETAVFVAELDAQARRSGRGSALAVARTGAALVAAERDDLAGAQALLADAMKWYDQSPLRFDRARTLLILGQVHRRAKSKKRAFDALREAQAEFDRFGASAWSMLASTELSRVNVRPGASPELTETERQVAHLAAQGLTNRQIAARSFLAVKTVEANLARAYRKLGIRSRAELGARWVDR